MSTLRRSVVWMAGPPSMGWPSGIDDAAEECLADGHGEQFAGGADGVAFLEFFVVAEDDGADGFFFEVEDLAEDAVGELEHFAGHGTAKAVDAGDAVADFDDLADLGDVELVLVLGDFLLDDRGDFVNLEFHVSSSCVRCGRVGRRLKPDRCEGAYATTAATLP